MLSFCFFFVALTDRIDRFHAAVWHLVLKSVQWCVGEMVTHTLFTVNLYAKKRRRWRKVRREEKLYNFSAQPAFSIITQSVFRLPFISNNLKRIYVCFSSLSLSQAPFSLALFRSAVKIYWLQIRFNFWMVVFGTFAGLVEASFRGLPRS